MKTKCKSEYRIDSSEEDRIKKEIKVAICRELSDIIQDPFNNEDFVFADAEVYFCLRRFLKFSFYHILYLLIFGPFFTLFMLLTGKG
jgi:hypothetical protein